MAECVEPREVSGYPDPVYEVICHGKTYNIKVDTQGIQWNPTTKGKAGQVEWMDVIAVRPGKPVKVKVGFKQDEDESCFTLYHIEKLGKKGKIIGNVWKVAPLVFKTTSNTAYSVNVFAENINTQVLRQVHDRPRNLLVVLNPASGKFKGQEIYENQVEPLFQLAGINTEVIILQKGGHARAIMQEHDLRNFDGIISAGGDGTFADCLNGLIERAMKKAGKNIHDHTLKFELTEKRLGIIPSGTANQMTNFFYGTRDIVTSTLNIITGVHFIGDVSACYCNDEYVYSGTLSVASGMFSDMLVCREESRAKGITHITPGSFKPIFYPKEFPVEVHVLKENGNEKDPNDWEVIKKDKVTDAFNFMADFDEKIYFPGFMPLDIFEPTSKWKMAKYLFSFMMLKPKRDEPFITSRKTTMYKLKMPLVEEHLKSHPSGGAEANPVNNNLPGSVISVDGEIFPMKHHIIINKLHTKILRLFGSTAWKI